MIFIDLLFLILIILLGPLLYFMGKENGRGEAYREKSIEIISYGSKNIVLISEDYFSMEQVVQIEEAIKKDKPIIYKPSKRQC